MKNRCLTFFKTLAEECCGEDAAQLRAVKRHIESKQTNLLGGFALTAAKNGHVKTLSFLIDNEYVSVNYNLNNDRNFRIGEDFSTLLVTAIQAKQNKIIEMILGYKMKPDALNMFSVRVYQSSMEYYGNALHFAIDNNDPELVKTLLKAGANPDYSHSGNKNERNNISALAHAERRGNSEMYSILYEFSNQKKETENNVRTNSRKR